MRKQFLSKKIFNYKELESIVNAYRVLGKKVVFTIGSWDMLHIGHLRYLARAKALGDILVVGVDSDKAIKTYKDDPLRPVIPENERMEMLGYQEFIDYVTLINDVDNKGNWKMGLIKTVRPDIFVAVEGESYPEEQKRNIAKFSGQVHLLPRQARRTSTTEIIERVFKKKIKDILGK